MLRKTKSDAAALAAPQPKKGSVAATKPRTQGVVLEMPFWRRTPSMGRRKPIGIYGVDMGERGIYDKRNSLNELTGKEWTYFLNSVLIKAYPPVADQCGFDLRKIHPCPKPPFLMRDIISFFTKRDQWILDPFAGVGGSLLGASLCDFPRNTVGLDINPQYVAAYRSACSQQALRPQKMICADARKMLSLAPIKSTEFDLILTDPPYSDLMARPKNGHKKKLYGRNDPTPFSASPLDLGNLGYDDFIDALKEILALAVSRLKDKKYLVVFCRDLQPIPGRPNILHADLIKAISTIPHILYRGMRIWHDQAADLYPFGYPYAFVMNQMHQYILIFRKESGTAIKKH